MELLNKQFGRLTVLERLNNNKNGHPVWRCQCSCGKKTNVIQPSLINGTTQSCGCLGIEKRINSRKTHGMTGSKPYYVWKEMRQRCNNPKNHAYNWYGELGIHVCNEWNNSFEIFYSWLLSNNYEQGLTVDRIDCDGDYCPENCRLITIQEQQRCRRNVIYFGDRLASDIAIERGIKLGTFYYRIYNGYSVEEALNPNFKRTRYNRGSNGKFKS